MNAKFWLLANVFEVTMKNIPFMILTDFPPLLSIAHVVSICKYIQV